MAQILHALSSRSTNSYFSYRTNLQYLMCHSWTLHLAGDDFKSAQQLLESLWAYEEWKNEQHIESDADFVARAEQLRRHFADSAATAPSATSPTTREPASASAKQTDAAQDSVCVVCLCAARSVVLIPCGHFAVCQSCYNRLQQCPICRSVIRGSIRSRTTEFISSSEKPTTDCRVLTET